MLRTTFGTLEKALRTQPNICLPDVSESFYKDLLHRKDDANNYKQRLPPNFHELINMASSDGEAETLTMSRITDADARKFFNMSNKGYLTAEDIKQRLPAEYHDLYEAFLPQEVDAMPLTHSYDHKIELVPGSTTLFLRNRQLSPMELRVLKRWLHDNLAKGFIRLSQSSATSPILLAQQPRGGVRICMDYRGINNVTMQSRYSIPLCKETLDSICKV
jgi:hypothetical protein